MEYGLLGETLSHSYSPRIHALLGNYDYRLLPTPPEEVAPLLKRREFQGLNVTIPYKTTVLPLCDQVAPEAQRIGSINTIVHRNGALWGYNTDFDGFLALLHHAGVELFRKKLLILGSGGTMRTVRAVAEHLRAREIVVVSRSGDVTYRHLHLHRDADVIVNTTPVGMFPCAGAAPVDLTPFPHLSGVLDVVYNPLRTALILQAQQLGIPCSGGLPMLVEQARRAAELFTGRRVPSAQSVLSHLTRETENLILIGMPGCGKSTIGAALAAQLNRPHADTDELLTKRHGVSIPELMEIHGINGFRKLETALLAEIGQQSGLVISTGGGVVTQSENFSLLRQNGCLIRLTRPLSQLVTEGRPLSVDLPRLWQEREPLYRSWAQLVIENNAAPHAVAARLWEVYHEAAGSEWT